jgi:hypothetical protein
VVLNGERARNLTEASLLQLLVWSFEGARSCRVVLMPTQTSFYHGDLRCYFQPLAFRWGSASRVCSSLRAGRAERRKSITDSREKTMTFKVPSKFAEMHDSNAVAVKLAQCLDSSGQRVGRTVLGRTVWDGLFWDGLFWADCFGTNHWMDLEDWVWDDCFGTDCLERTVLERTVLDGLSWSGPFSCCLGGGLGVGLASGNLGLGLFWKSETLFGSKSSSPGSDWV